MMFERDEHALRGLTGVGIQLMADGQPPGSLARRAAADRCTFPAPGAKPTRTGPGRRVGDRLVLRGEDLPLPAEVIPASAVGAIWVYKKGSHVLTRRLADITRYWHGIPFLAPEVVLLIKARPGPGRPGTDNDQRDFEAALPVLSSQQRSWLKDAIEGTLTAAAPAPVDGAAGQRPSPASVKRRAKRSLAAGSAGCQGHADAGARTRLVRAMIVAGTGALLAAVITFERADRN